MIRVEDQAETQVVGLAAVQEVDLQVVPVAIQLEDLGNQVEVADIREEALGAGEEEEVILEEVRELPVPLQAVVGMEAKVVREGFNSREAWDLFQDAVTADLRAGREMMDKLAVCMDKLESAPDGEDTVVLGGNTL